MRLLLGAVVLSLCFAPSALSQTIEVNRQNRTVEVVVAESARVEPDVAKVTLGCLEYGQTQDEAYQANLAAADKVIKALLSAGVPKTQIESNTIELTEVDPSDMTLEPPAVRKARQFKAHQSWLVRVQASEAQKIIDQAVQAGANGIEDVTWDVADTDALEAKVRAAAMGKARTTAAEIAQSGGGKLGQLLYASNTVNGIVGSAADRSVIVSARGGGGGGGRPVTPMFSLHLFPQKVEKEATVRAIFALD